jgi:apolipoprotein N-acyltransferase
VLENNNESCLSRAKQGELTSCCFLSTENPYMLFVIAIISGAVLTLAFAPFRIWPCSFLSILSLIWLFSKQQHAKGSFYLGFVFGVGFFASSVSWVFVSIYKYGGTSIILALLITSLFIIFLALFPAINLYLLKKLKLDNPVNWRFIIAFPASWALLEIFRSWFLTGFPWVLLGYTQLSSPLKYYASLFGVYGVSFIVLLIAALISSLCWRFKRGRGCSYIIISLILLIFFSPIFLLFLNKKYNKQNYDLESNKHIVAIIQGNIAPNDKFLFQDSSGLIKHISEIYLQPTKDLAKEIDLVIWPENSLPLEVQDPDANAFLYDIDQFAKYNNFGLLLGIPIQHRYKYNYFYNSVLGLGTATGEYYKTNLVPFGDYVPLEDLLRGIIGFFDLPMSRFVAGDLKQAAIKFNKHNLLATVCYDITYAEDLRYRVLTQNPSVIVTVSEDGWFGDSLGPPQHLDIARMRAIETGRYVLRATTSGISAVIDNYGNIVKQAPVFKKFVLISQYQDCFNQTIWNKLGNKLIIGFLLICLGVSKVKFSRVL